MKTIHLTPELEEMINQQVKTGKYRDHLAVIQEGLHLLAERERIYQDRFQELKEDIMIGVQELRQGDCFDGESVFQELEEDIQTLNP